MSYEQRRKALPIAANVELIRRIDIAKSLIHEAHMLSLEEAKKCAPRLWAARKNVGTIISIVGLIVGFIIVVIGGIITGSFNGLRSFNVIGITLMFSSLYYWIHDTSATCGQQVPAIQKTMATYRATLARNRA